MRLGVVSDLHYTTGPVTGLAYHNAFEVPGVLRRLRIALRWFERERIDALLLTGDLSQFGDVDALLVVLQIVTERWSGPTFVIAGNHDTLLRDDALIRVLERLRSHRIALPRPEGVVLGGVRIAALDPAPPQGARAIVTWGSGPTVLISHFPLFSRARMFARHGFKYAGDLPGGEPIVAAVLAREAPTIVVSGHLHCRDSLQRGVALQLTVGALVEPPFEATIIDVTTAHAATTVRRRARALQMNGGDLGPALAPADETWTLVTP